MKDDNWTYATRRVRNKPNFFKGDRVSSALFKDTKGVSVDKDHERSVDEVLCDEERLHEFHYGEIQKTNPEYRLRAIVAVDKEICDEREIEVIDCPEEYNPHHAILVRNQENKVLTAGQAKALAHNAKMIKQYDNESLI